MCVGSANVLVELVTEEGGLLSLPQHDRIKSIKSHIHCHPSAIEYVDNTHCLL